MSVCPACARRAWLLARLSARLDFRSREQSRFWSLLELPDLELIEAIGGRRRAELHAAYAAWEPAKAQEDAGMDTMSICRHHPAYPRSIREDPLGPHALSVRGDMERLRSMLDGKVVAIVGTRRASDYGMETARELARGLAASGLVIASGLAEGIPAAAHAGALESAGRDSHRYGRLRGAMRARVVRSALSPHRGARLRCIGKPPKPANPALVAAGAYPHARTSCAARDRGRGR
jgi:DNA processing protein